MFDFFRAGGFSMVFVLLFGVLTAAAAVRFALRPDARIADAVRALTYATMFSVGCGIFSDIAAVCIGAYRAIGGQINTRLDTLLKNMK